jgi:hypothetical protein
MTGTLRDLSDEERRSLAARIAKEREGGWPWDGVGGICGDRRFPLVNTATQGRKLLREIGREDLISESYDRAAYGLKGSRKRSS